MMNEANEAQTKAEQFYQEYEVFSQKKDTAPVQYQFSLLAPNEDMAMMLAREAFFRREIPNDIWVIKREHIRTLHKDEKEALQRLDKPYRETKGYADAVERWRKFREQEEGEQA